MSKKSQKIISVIVNVIVAIILVMVLFVTISTILSSGQGYTSIFGVASVSVQSDSMKGENKDNFVKGDLLFVKVLNDEEKKTLEVGQIITFRDKIEGFDVLNTHRIIEVIPDTAGNGNVSYRTKGDNNTAPDAALRDYKSVIGLYEGSKIPAVGSFIDFINTSTGFLVLVVVPSFLIVAYFGFNLFVAVKQGNKEKKAEEASEKERMREELLKELQAEGKLAATEGTDSPSEESAEETEEAEAEAEETEETEEATEEDKDN